MFGFESIQALELHRMMRRVLQLSHMAWKAASGDVEEVQVEGLHDVVWPSSRIISLPVNR